MGRPLAVPARRIQAVEVAEHRQAADDGGQSGDGNPEGLALRRNQHPVYRVTEVRGYIG